MLSLIGLFSKTTFWHMLWGPLEHSLRPETSPKSHCLECYLALEAIATKWMVEACDSCHAK